MTYRCSERSTRGRRLFALIGGRILPLYFALVLCACSTSPTPLRPSNVPWLPQPGDYGATLDDCSNTVFSSDPVMAPVDVPERQLPGLNHVECWVSHGGESIDEDGAEIIALVADRLSGEKTLEGFSCEYVFIDGPWVQGRAPFYGCYGQVTVSELEVSQVVAVYAAIATTDDESSVLLRERKDGGSLDFAGLEVHWLFVTADIQLGFTPESVVSGDMGDFLPSPPVGE